MTNDEKLAEMIKEMTRLRHQLGMDERIFNSKRIAFKKALKEHYGW